MNLKSNIKYILGGLSLLMISGVILTSCKDDVFQGYNAGQLGEKVHGTLSLPLITPSGDVKTRSVDFSENALIKIDAYWVGVFDTKTGEKLGEARDDESRKEDGTRQTVTAQSPFTVQDIDIYYYEANPEVYVVGVINYNDILAKKTPGEDVAKENLIDILSTANNIKDLFSISLDLQSVDKANYQEESSGLQQRPLMMGYYMPDGANLHSMVDLGGEGFTNFSNNRVRITDAPSGGIQLQPGNIRLERLMADVNVKINPGEGVTIKRVSMYVRNNPMEMYLAEHIVDPSGAIKGTLEEYLANTANSADFLEEGYQDSPHFIINPNDDGSYSVNYQYYENKHWGRTRTFPDGIAYSHKSREQLYDISADIPVLRSLCNDVTKPFNNNASYMVIEAEISVDPRENGNSTSYDSGVVRYTIHEGCASSREGYASKNGFDYQRMRNTSYTYNITINGMDDLITNVTVTDMYNGHNNGIGGRAWSTNIYQIEPSQDQEVVGSVEFFDKTDLLSMTWRVEDIIPGEIKNYGTWTPAYGAPLDFPKWSAFNRLDPSLPESLEDQIYFLYGERQIKFKDIRDQADSFSYPLDLNLAMKPIEVSEWYEIEQYRRNVYISVNDMYTDNAGSEAPQVIFGYEMGAFDFREDFNEVSPIPYYHSGHSINFCGAWDVITWISWSPAGPPPNENGVQYYELQIDDQTPYHVDATTWKTTMDSSWIISFPVLLNRNLSIGKHKITITPYGDPSLWRPAQPTVWEDYLEVTGEPLWISSKLPFRETLEIMNKNPNNNQVSYDEKKEQYTYTGSELEYGGLTVKPGGGDMIFGPDYIQTNGDGNTNKRCFILYVDRPGTIKIAASTTGNQENGRYLKVNYNGNTLEREVSVPSTTKDANYEFEITGVNTGSSYPVPIYIYTQKSLRIYSIQYIRK